MIRNLLGGQGNDHLTEILENRRQQHNQVNNFLSHDRLDGGEAAGGTRSESNFNSRLQEMQNSFPLRNEAIEEIESDPGQSPTRNNILNSIMNNLRNSTNVNNSDGQIISSSSPNRGNLNTNNNQSSVDNI